MPVTKRKHTLSSPKKKMETAVRDASYGHTHTHLPPVSGAACFPSFTGIPSRASTHMIRQSSAEDT